MRQRLGLAQALLGDPPVLVLDEPANGLDPAGIAWLRQFLRALAQEGRTVLISSHVLAEVQQTVDEVVVIARGRLVTQGTLADLEPGPAAVLVRTPTPALLRDALGRRTAVTEVDGRLRVEGCTTDESATSRTAPASSCTSWPPSPATWRSCSSELTQEGPA